MVVRISDANTSGLEAFLEERQSRETWRLWALAARANMKDEGQDGSCLFTCLFLQVS